MKNSEIETYKVALTVKKRLEKHTNLHWEMIVKESSMGGYHYTMLLGNVMMITESHYNDKKYFWGMSGRHGSGDYNYREEKDSKSFSSPEKCFDALLKLTKRCANKQIAYHQATLDAITTGKRAE